MAAREDTVAKVVLSMFMTLDGYFAGLGGEFMPPPWSDGMEAWALEAMRQSGHFLYGRVNFQFNKGFWEEAKTDPDSPAAGIAYAGEMNAKPKTVFSRTLKGDPGWNATLVSDDIPARIAELKATNEKDLFLFGGARLARSFIDLDLVDEYRLLVTPAIQGSGERLFGTGTRPIDLAFVESRPIDTGAVLLRYRRSRET
jgi:dihydrofolate reductase